MSWKFKITLIIPDLSQEMWTGSPRLKRPAASSSANLKKEKEEETNAEQSETHDTGTQEGAEEETPRTVDPCVDPDETTPKTAVSKKSSCPEGGKPAPNKGKHMRRSPRRMGQQAIHHPLLKGGFVAKQQRQQEGQQHLQPKTTMQHRKQNQL